MGLFYMKFDGLNSPLQKSQFSLFELKKITPNQFEYNISLFFCFQNAKVLYVNLFQFGTILPLNFID